MYRTRAGSSDLFFFPFRKPHLAHGMERQVMGKKKKKNPIIIFLYPNIIMPSAGEYYGGERYDELRRRRFQRVGRSTPRPTQKFLGLYVVI